MEEKHILCLNCSAPLEGNFCSDCGQSAKVRRFTFRHVLTHDFVHGIIHYDKGILFTIKELFTRPGHSVREYINGKRVKHLNYLSFLVLLILLFSAIEAVTPFHRADLTRDGKEIVESIEGLVKHHPKWIYIGIIPIYAMLSFLFFRRARQNYSEHFVLNSFKLAVAILLNILFVAIASFLKDIPTLVRVSSILTWIILGYGTWFYYQYFSPFYNNKFLLIFRSLFCAAMPFVLVLIGLIAYMVFLSQDQGLDMIWK